MTPQLALVLLIVIAPILVAGTPTFAAPSSACRSDIDCSSGYICDIEFVACATNPQASECVRKVCVPNPQAAVSSPQPPDKQTLYAMHAVMEAGPHRSQMLRILLSWNMADRSVWTELNETAWRRVLHGEKRVKARIHTCTGWGTPQARCVAHPGIVEFMSPVSGKFGETIQGALRYNISPPTKTVAYPFTATLQWAGK